MPSCALSSLVLAAHYVFVQHIYSGTKSGYGVFELNNERLNQVKSFTWQIWQQRATNFSTACSRATAWKSDFRDQVFSIHSYPYIFLLLYEHVRLPYEFCVFLCQCFMVIMGHKSLSLYEEDENGGRPDIVVRRSERTTLCRRYVDIVWVLYIKKLNFLLSRRNRVSF